MTARRRTAAPQLRILYAAAELHPFIKTGGLGDVSAALPQALHEAGVDVRIVLPAYRAVMDRVPGASPAAAGIPGTTARLLQCTLPPSGIPVYLVDAPAHFDRAGGPYRDDSGMEWPDNAARFALFCRAIAALARGAAGLGWQPDILHANDWHTGLAAALLGGVAKTPATLFAIHNLAYQGIFPRTTFDELDLPVPLWSPEGLEFHGSLSFIKGGLVFSDRLTTVSPTYAREILTPEHGFGLDGLLRHRADRLGGILNGVDYATWDPRRDPHIPANYRGNALGGKHQNKLALQEELGLDRDGEHFVIGYIARLTQQKGTDLLLEALPELLSVPGLQLALLGEGEPRFHAALAAAARSMPDRVGLHLGFDDPLAHRILAGADAVLVPSRFEPCGLTQLYALRYGTVPIVRLTGGLADTVVDATDANLANCTATGFTFGEADAGQVTGAVPRAAAMRGSSRRMWRQLVQTGMKQDFSWTRSAEAYIELYRETITTG